MTPYNFDFEITDKDLKYASRDVWRVPHFFKLQQAYIILPVVFIVITAISFFLPSSLFNVFFKPLLFISLFFIYLIFCMYISTFIGIKKCMKGSDLKRNMIIDVQGIKQTNVANTTTWNWAGIVHVSNQKDTIFLFVGERMFILIPKRVFKDEEELNNFWGYIQDCYNQEHTGK